MRQQKNSSSVLTKEEYIGLQNSLHISERTLSVPFPLHSHEFFEIEYIREGKGRHFLNGTWQAFEKNTVYLLTPEDVHALYPTEQIRHLNIMFSEELFPDKIAFETLMGCYGMQIHLSPENADCLEKLFDTLLKETKTPVKDAYHFSYVSNISQCILITILRAGNTTAPLVTDHALSQTLFYLRRHFREPLTLQAMAERAHFTPSYFCSLFKKITGKNFTEYLSDLRTRYAYHLLKSGQSNILDICFQSGFSSFPSFSREFKKRYGCSPSSVLKNISNERNKL